MPITKTSEKSHTEDLEMSTQTANVVTTSHHFHHWRIEEANGPRSVGTCKYCGAEKQFKNWLEDSDFITNEEHRSTAAAA
ncbi:MAG: hypothetical protein WD557_13380 [Dehalococcoidia bacterium]